MKFTPAGSADMSTLFSAGGNFYIRAQGNELRYGFDSLAGSTWTSNKATVEYPALNKEHALSFHYLPSPTGATLSVMLDGVALPTVTSTAPAKNATDMGSVFGFGYEVNPGGAGRGFSGMLHDVRLAKATGSDVLLGIMNRRAGTERVAGGKATLTGAASVLMIRRRGMRA